MPGLSITFNVPNFPRPETEYINIAGDDFSRVIFENNGNNVITIQMQSVDSSGTTKEINYRYTSNVKTEENKVKKHPLIKLREGDDNDFISSNLKYIIYDANKQELAVSFDLNSNIIYVYTPVDIYLFYEMMNANSIGSYFNKEIKNNPNVACSRESFDDYMDEIGIGEEEVGDILF